MRLQHCWAAWSYTCTPSPVVTLHVQLLDHLDYGGLCGRLEPGLPDHVHYGGKHLDVATTQPTLTHGLGQISCLMPHIHAVNNTALALAALSLVALVLLCVALGTHNWTDRDFWGEIRNDFIDERTDVPPEEVIIH